MIVSFSIVFILDNALIDLQSFKLHGILWNDPVHNFECYSEGKQGYLIIYHALPHNERRFPSKNYNRGQNGGEKARGRQRMMLLN